MNIFEIIRNISEECIEPGDLNSLITSGEPMIAYDGFEPSGRIHIAQGILRTINTNKLTQCGCKFKFWIADWFAMLNHKYDGDLDKIKIAGELMIETFKACGMNLENVEFLWSSEEINKNPGKYWGIVMDIAMKFNLNRVIKCTQIMGRSESDDLSTSQIMYPLMQCADIFYLDVNICSLGLDQRKVNMLAREYCDKIKKVQRPVILSHHMILGLKGEDKMSKSDPESAIYMDDTEADVNRKIKKAYCPPGEKDKNPILEYCQYIIFEKFNIIVIERKNEFGGNVIFSSYAYLESSYVDGQLHPSDLKKAVAKYINKLLEPVRKYFDENENARNLRDKVKNFKK
jgi:tyrosyl-tRNA synthetase